MVEKLKIITFKNSKESFISLLKQKGITFTELFPPTGTIMAAGEIIEILKTVGAASIFPSLATVAVQWLKARSSRKLMLQTKDKQVVHLEGYSAKEVAGLIEQANSLTVIDTKPNQAN